MTYENIMKGFTKVQKKLEKLIDANGNRMDAIDDKVNALYADRNELLDESVKAEQALSKLKEFTGEC